MDAESAPKSLSDVIRGRQAKAFVGRNREIALFADNLDRGVDDPGRKVIFAVDGQAGVGKSYLTRFWLASALRAGSLTAVSDEETDDILSLIGSFATQLGRQSYFFSGYERARKQYSRRRTSLLKDASAPEGTGNVITGATVRLTLAAAKLFSATASVANQVDGDTAVDYVNQARQFLTQKLKRESDFDLVLAPVPILSAAFLKDLREVALDVPNVVLCVDTFERRSRWTQEWLLRMLDEEYGPLPSNLILLIAGQVPLNSNKWSAYSSVIERFSLSEFSEQEVEALLRSYDLPSEPELVRSVLGSTRGLPVLVDLFAQSDESRSGTPIDPSESAVERFLKHEADPVRRSLILRAAHARVVNSASLATTVDSSENDVADVELASEGEAFLDWLSRLPFVQKQDSSWKFHQVVRLFLVRYFRERNPEAAIEVHRSLANFYGDLIEQFDFEADDVGTLLHDYNVEFIYHILCSRYSGRVLQIALRECISAVADQPDRALLYAQAVVDAGNDCGDDRVARLGRKLLAAGTYAEERRQGAMLNAFIDSGALDDTNVAVATAGRAYVDFRLGNYESVLRDAEASLGVLKKHDELEKNLYWRTVRIRAFALLRFERYQDCLRQLDIAAEGGDEADFGGSVIRSRALRAIGSLAEARLVLADAVQRKPDMAALRGEYAIVLEETGLYLEAIEQWSALLRMSNHHEALLRRGMAYRWVGEYQKCLDDIGETARFGKVSHEASVRRCEALLHLGSPGEAVEEARKCASVDDMMGWATFVYGQILLAMGDRPAANHQFHRALSIGTKNVNREAANVAARFNTAVYCAATGASARARRLLADFYRMNDDPERVAQASILLREFRNIGFVIEGSLQ